MELEWSEEFFSQLAVGKKNLGMIITWKYLSGIRWGGGTIYQYLRINAWYDNHEIYQMNEIIKFRNA